MEERIIDEMLPLLYREIITLSLHSVAGVAFATVDLPSNRSPTITFSLSGVPGRTRRRVTIFILQASMTSSVEPLSHRRFSMRGRCIRERQGINNACERNLRSPGFLR